MTTINDAIDILIHGQTLKADLDNSYVLAKKAGSLFYLVHFNGNGRLIEARPARNGYMLEKLMTEIAEITDWQVLN